LEKIENQRVGFADRVTAGTEAPESVLRRVIEDAIGDDAASRIAGTQEQDVHNVLGHDYFSPQQLSATADGTSGAQQVLLLAIDSRPLPYVGAEPNV
jgi:hypothetical protein